MPESLPVAPQPGDTGHVADHATVHQALQDHEARLDVANLTSDTANLTATTGHVQYWFDPVGGSDVTGAGTQANPWQYPHNANWDALIPDIIRHWVTIRVVSNYDPGAGTDFFGGAFTRKLDGGCLRITGSSNTGGGTHQFNPETNDAVRPTLRASLSNVRLFEHRGTVYTPGPTRTSDTIAPFSMLWGGTVSEYSPNSLIIDSFVVHRYLYWSHYLRSFSWLRVEHCRILSEAINYGPDFGLWGPASIRSCIFDHTNQQAHEIFDIWHNPLFIRLDTCSVVGADRVVCRIEAADINYAGDPTMLNVKTLSTTRLAYIRWGRYPVPAETYSDGDLDIYYDPVGGNDTTGNGSVSAPFKTFGNHPLASVVPSFINHRVTIHIVSDVSELGMIPVEGFTLGLGGFLRITGLGQNLSASPLAAASRPRTLSSQWTPTWFRINVHATHPAPPVWNVSTGQVTGGSGILIDNFHFRSAEYNESLWVRGSAPVRIAYCTFDNWHTREEKAVTFDNHQQTAWAQSCDAEGAYVPRITVSNGGRLWAELSPNVKGFSDFGELWLAGEHSPYSGIWTWLG